LVQEIIAKISQSVVSISTDSGGTYSGWIIDNTGDIITCNSRLNEGIRQISFPNGAVYTPKAIRSDPDSGIAIIKVSGQELPAPLTLGDSTNVKIGEWVLAVGFSGGGVLATKGIVSDIGVTEFIDNGKALSNLIITDAAINPGVMGCPLVRIADGKIIGMNVHLQHREGTGGAVSSNDLIPVIQKLVQDSSSSRTPVTPVITSPSSAPEITPTAIASTPRNIVLTSSPSPVSTISSVVLKVLNNDAKELVFGFDFLDSKGQPVSFSGFDNARFCGSIWQGHPGNTPVSYIIKIDEHINTNLDTITAPYSILDFSGVDKTQYINVDFRIYGLFTNTPNHINLDNYWFQLLMDRTVIFDGSLIHLPATIPGKKG
jgi:hypothetical protein